ncbi:MAG: tetratricopeptide repeat protein [Deltaproteobacteria bacterium]|nr:tetratricopeptide repeat protein [Deltaproteobacteria bacterium]
MDSHFHFYHSAKGRGKGGFPKLFWLCLAVAVLVLVVFFWNLLSPVSFARFLGNFSGKPLVVEKLDAELDGKALALAPGGRLKLKPSQRLRFLKIESSRWRDYDLSLFSDDFDVRAFTSGENTLAAALGEDYFLEPRTFAVQVKDKDEEKAVFYLDAAYEKEDFVFKGDSAANVEDKAGYYRRALEMDPEDLELAEKLALALEEGSGGGSELAALWERLLKASSDDQASKALLLKLLAYYKSARDVPGEIRSLESLSALAEKSGESPRVYRMNLAVLYRENDPAKAALIYEETLEEEDPEARIASLFTLADIYRKTGDDLKLARSYERLLPLVSAEQAPGIWNQLIRLREAAGDEPGRLAAWEGLAASLPPGRTKVDAYKHLGFSYAGKEDYDSAEKAYETALSLAPEDSSILLNLAALAERRGDGEKYRRYLEKAAGLSGSHELKRQLAAVYAADGMEKEALDLWLELSEINPETDELKALRSEARIRALELSRPPQGEVSDVFEERLYRYSWNSVEFYNLGVTHFKLKNWDRAEKAFLQALYTGEGGKPWSRDVHGYLLAIYKERGEKEKLLSEAMLLYQDDPGEKDYRDLAAIEMEAAANWPALEKAASEWVKISPDDPDNWRYLALAQKSLGKNAETAASLFSAAERDPKSVSAWLSAGEALERVGDFERAKTAFQNVIALDDQNDKATQALLRFTLADLSSSREAGGAN